MQSTSAPEANPDNTTARLLATVRTASARLASGRSSCTGGIDMLPPLRNPENAPFRSIVAEARFPRKHEGCYWAAIAGLLAYSGALFFGPSAQRYRNLQSFALAVDR